VEAAPRALAQPLDRVEVDPEIDLRRDLVHVLTPGPGGAAGAKGDRARRDSNGFASPPKKRCGKQRIAGQDLLARSDFNRVFL
jgi:hypothetical protein